MRRRQFELGINHEQGNVLDFTEGLGGARYEQVVGRRISSATVEGADLVDPRLGPLSLKGPLGVNSATGRTFRVTQDMIDGLGKSVIKDVQRNTYTRRVVVDLMGLTPSQRAAFIQRLQNALGPNPAKEIFIIY